MRIKEITYQHRRDFTAFYECQFCGLTVERYGYDDQFFHENVIPKMVCPRCGKSVEENSDEMDFGYRPLATKYPEGFQI